MHKSMVIWTVVFLVGICVFVGNVHAADKDIGKNRLIVVDSFVDPDPWRRTSSLYAYFNGDFRLIKSKEVESFYGYGWLDDCKVFIAYATGWVDSEIAIEVVDLCNSRTVKLKDVGGDTETNYDAYLNTGKVVFNEYYNDGGTISVLSIDLKNLTYHVEVVKKNVVTQGVFWIDADTIGYGNIIRGSKEESYVREFKEVKIGKSKGTIRQDRLIVLYNFALMAYSNDSYIEVTRADPYSFFNGYGWLDKCKVFTASLLQSGKSPVAEVKVFDICSSKAVQVGKFNVRKDSNFDIDPVSKSIVFNDSTGIRLLSINPKDLTYKVKSLKENVSSRGVFWIDNRTIGYMNIKNDKFEKIDIGK